MTALMAMTTTLRAPSRQASCARCIDLAIHGKSFSGLAPEFAEKKQGYRFRSGQTGNSPRTQAKVLALLPICYLVHPI
jgi:hypothetical protein